MTPLTALFDRATRSYDGPLYGCENGVQSHHQDLYRAARRELRRMVRSGTIDTVALVNEAYLRARKGEAVWQNKEHFLASMTTMMRHVLVDYARERGAQRRGGDWLQVTTSGLDGVSSNTDTADLISVHEAITALGRLSGRLEKVVELKVFGGLTIDEMAVALDISKATVSRELRLASAFLRNRLAEAA